MCRMVGFAAWGPGVSTASRLLRLLARAARSDPYLEALGARGGHCHGYGFYALLRRGGGWLTVYERFDAYDFLGDTEEACRANLEALGEAVGRLGALVEGSEEAVVVAHARRAGREEPRGTWQAHPYLHVLSHRGGPEYLALAHNGSLTREGKALLAAHVNLDPSAYTDSAVLAYWLSRQLLYGRSLAEALQEAKRHVKTALDLLVARVDSRAGYRPRLYAVGYLAQTLSEAKKEYYKPVLVESEGLQAYLSSTVYDYALEEGLQLRLVRDEPAYIAELEPHKELKVEDF